MRLALVLLILVLIPILTPCAIACATGSSTVTSLVREQFDRFIVLQRRGPPKSFLMPFYTAYISDLDAFVADRGSCTQALGPCCLVQNDIDNFHAIHDRSLVDSKIASLLSLDPSLFYLPTTVVADADLPALTSEQQAEVDIMWAVTTEALENPPNSYVAIWSMLPEGLKILHDPRRDGTCAEFEKYKSSASSSKFVTSVRMIHEVAAIALHAQLLGVSDDTAVQLLFHATAFIFNGIRCEIQQNENLEVPTSFYPFYAAKMRQEIQGLGESVSAIPDVPTAAVDTHLADSLRVLSSYNSWGRIEHLVSNGLVTDKRNIKEDIFSPTALGNILQYMLDNVVMTDEQRANVQTRKDEADSLANVQSFQISHFQFVASKTGWSTPLSLTPAAELKIAYRQAVTCTPNLFHAYPQNPAAALNGCCADLCDQTSLLQTLSPPMSKTACCIHCSEDTCDVEANPSNPLSALEEVHLIPYYEEGSEVVNL